MIYICSTRDGKKWAKEMISYFLACDCSCFYPPRDITLGMEYGQETARAIDDSEAFVYLLTKQSNGNEFCLSELAYAMKKKKKAVLLFAQPVAPSSQIRQYMPSMYVIRGEASFSDALISLRLYVTGRIPGEEKKEPAFGAGFRPDPAPGGYAAVRAGAGTPAAQDTYTASFAKPVPYTGNEPYLFISYAHRDRAAVYPILCRMTGMGLRIWFDEGIAPGTTWDDAIARKVEACDGLIAFISDNYVASGNCKDELNFARNKDRPLLLVYLQDTELPPGMDMRLNRIQAIMRYACAGDGELCRKLLECEFVARNRSGG